MMKKQAMKSVLGMLVFSALYSGVVPSALAYGTAPPTGSTEAYFLNPALPLYQMSDLQKELIAQLKLFDRTYCRWAHEGISVPSIWHYLAADVFGPYNDMPCKGGESDSNFILRGKLASGICSLYEAHALMEKGPHFKQQALAAYDIGLERLEKVIQIGKENPSIVGLPNYSAALRTNAEKDVFFMHPLAGCETILVGMSKFPMQSPFTRELITNRPLQTMHTAPFVSLENYRKRLQGWYGRCSSEEIFHEAKETQFKQGSTDATARFFLSEFCPWGLGLYRTLRDAGLTRGLDWRILRPFAGDAPQDLCEFSVTKPFLIPNHILGELNQVVGDGKSGFLDLEKKSPVRWAWVSQPPTYTIKYISPMVHERVRSDEQFSKAMGIVKLVFGGPIDWGMDQLFSGLLGEVEHYYGKDSELHYVSWLVVHGNDKGFITTDFAEKRELSGMTLFKKTIGAAFVAFENQMVEDMYEGIDPRHVALGTGYNGQPIPAIMFRGDVLGFQKIPPVEYGRTIQPVRHYLLRPSAIACKAPGLLYDLSKNEGLGALRKDAYLKEQWVNDPQKKEVIRRNAWERLPSPFGARDYVHDFSPAYQIFKVGLPKKEFGQWIQTLPKEKLLHVQLWQRSADKKNRLILNERIHDPALRLVVYNMHSPEGKSAFISAEMKYGSATHNRKIGTGKMHPKTYRYFGPSDHRRQAVSSLAMELTNRLQTRYRLVITQGKDGEMLAEYPLVIAPGRGKAAVPVTGKLTGLEGGGVVLDYNISSKQFAGMNFFGNTGGERLDAWIRKEVVESSRGSLTQGKFVPRGFVCMSFDEQGQCRIKDFKYTVIRAQALDESRRKFRAAWVTVTLHFDPAKPEDPRMISGSYSSTAKGNTWREDIELFRATKKQYHENVQGAGSWVLTKNGASWMLRLQPGHAPLSEMLVPIEATFEEE